MDPSLKTKAFRFSVVVPCYNEQRTLEESVSRLIQAFSSHPQVELEVIIVDDCSTDSSRDIANKLKAQFNGVRLLEQPRNAGKGAALRLGFRTATGDFVGIHDADLEYDPKDLHQLLVPLMTGQADVVYGSRFLTGEAHRVLYFWHSLGNQFLTLLSNMVTDLNLSDMETCYKVFRREVIQSIRIDEDRFGFEPEITAKVAALRVRVYEVGISYYGRTYEEGKKIGVKDGFRALYCILKYNINTATAALQFFFYSLVGGFAALGNLLCFAVLYGFFLHALQAPLQWAVTAAFVVSAAANYWLCTTLLFRHKARWSAAIELVVYGALSLAMLGVDLYLTGSWVAAGLSPLLAKALADVVAWPVNFAGRRWLVFPEPGRGVWKRQVPSKAPEQ